MDFSRQNVELAFNILYNGNNEEINNANLFLMEWTRTPGCHQTAFEILTESNDQHIRCTALSILYRQMQVHWNSFDEFFRNSVKAFFFKLFSEGFSSPAIANSSISIIVLISIFEWPELFSNFFDLVFNLKESMYTFQIVANFLKLLEDCDFITKSRLVSLRMNFINNNYIQKIIFLIQQITQNEQNQNLANQYTIIFLSIYNSLFEWCDIKIFLTQEIIYYIISKIPIHEAYECLSTLFINRTDSTEILSSILPNFLHSVVQSPNFNFLLQFLRKFGRILEKTENEVVSQLYSFLLTADFDDDYMDDFWNIWYVIIHRILFSVTCQDESSVSLMKTFTPLFELMRNKFSSLIPYAISNGKVVDYTAISTWEILNRIDKEGFLNFISNLQQKLLSEPEMRTKYCIDINYSFSSLNFLLKSTSNQTLFDMAVNYFTNLFQEGISNFDIQSSIFALSRSTIILSINQPIFQKYCESIMYCFKSSNLDLKETAANCFSFTINEIPEFFASTAKDFTIFFLNSVRDLLIVVIEEDIKDDFYVMMLFRCATCLASAISKQNKNIDITYFNLIVDPVLEILDESAPIALKIINEIGKSSCELCIYAFHKFWAPLFALAKMNDILINDLIIDALCSGFENCPFEQVQPQAKIFVDLLLNQSSPEIAVSAISACREKNSNFDEFYPFFENLLNIPSVELFDMYYVFSPRLIKLDSAMPLICEGIINVDINTCNSAISCIKKFLNSLDEPNCTSFVELYRKPILSATISSLIDFMHCSLVSRLSSILIKIIVSSKFLNVPNVEIDILDALKSLCQNEPAESEFENFIKTLVISCDDRKKANQVIADFLIIMRHVTPAEKMEILERIDDIDEDEKNVIQEIEKSLDIKS